MKNVNVAIVGLGFGAEFIPIYQAYPGATLVAICQRTEEKLKALGASSILVLPIEKMME